MPEMTNRGVHAVHRVVRQGEVVVECAWSDMVRWMHADRSFFGEVAIMWTVVYIAASEVLALDVCARLAHEGVLAKAKAIGSAKTRTEYQILVMQSELADVRELLPTVLHAALNAVRDGPIADRGT